MQTIYSTLDSMVICHTKLNDPKFVRPHPALKASFGHCFYKAALRMRVLFDVKLKPFGLIAPQYAMLSLLNFIGPVSQVNLGREMGIDKASMVKLVDGLENLKLVRRVAIHRDRRVKLIKITPKGLKFQKRSLKIRAEMEAEFLAPLTPSERKFIKKIIPKLLQIKPS